MASVPWDAKSSPEKYRTMGSWFLGPRGENHALMATKFVQIVERVRAGRLQYSDSHDDPIFITDDMIESQDFRDGVQAIDAALAYITSGLADHSVPFFSPRYAAHMAFDVSLPAVLGYLAAMLYNQNNVSPEASPFSSFIEYQVGQDLCAMLGYNTKNHSPEEGLAIGWGHITCGGSIANLESMWVARNLKYYPLSLHNAMKPGRPLESVAESFMTTLCTGESVKFFSCSPWQLLNLTPNEVLDLPGRLTQQFGISQDTLDRILEAFSIQTVGKDKLDRDFNITRQPQFLLSGANHYSWPKRAAILGIGKENILELRVDVDARLDLTHLEDELEKHLREEQPVYAVVAIIGTTEHGAVDPLMDIIRLRMVMQKKGLSFVVHADAAWGGYFASKIVPPVFNLPSTPPQYAFSIPLSTHTNHHMSALPLTDSITIDPHKSGYNPYPAGAICYRDGRFRSLTTWTSPVVSTKSGDDISMGIYGVEGSKPGAAPVAVWMSLKVLGTKGYAELLGVAMLTSIKMYANWATTTLDSKTLVITPFKQLPTERHGQNLEEIQEERKRIRDKIALRPNASLQTDQVTLAFMRELGSDLMINAFACNFHIGDQLNTDVVEASFLNERLYKRLSVTSMKDKLKEKPIVIMATEFSQEKYGTVLTRFKARMGLQGDEDMYALSSVSMSPWPTANDFVTRIIEDFKTVAEEEIKTCLVRVIEQPSMHSFVLHGSDELFLVYMSSFNVESYRRQIIVKAKSANAAMLTKLRDGRAKNPHTTFRFHTGLKTLSKLIVQTKWVGDIYEGFPTIYGSDPFLSRVEFDVEVVVNKSLRRSDLAATYPAGMPFYLFGTSSEIHMDHCLLRSPNVHLTASEVKLELPFVTDLSLVIGKLLILDAKCEPLRKEMLLREDMMQPFTTNHKPDFFAPNTTFNVSVYDKDPLDESPRLISKGTVTLPTKKSKLFVDFSYLNLPAATEIHISHPDAERQALHGVAAEVVKLFNEQKITWDDNVVKSIYRLCPDAEDLKVTLGSFGGHGTRRLRTLSRFLGPAEGCNKTPVENFGLKTFEHL